jgi:hypothetical protein
MLCDDLFTTASAAAAGKPPTARACILAGHGPFKTTDLRARSMVIGDAA